MGSHIVLRRRAPEEIQSIDLDELGSLDSGLADVLTDEHRAESVRSLKLWSKVLPPAARRALEQNIAVLDPAKRVRSREEAIHDFSADPRTLEVDPAIEGLLAPELLTAIFAEEDAPEVLSPAAVRVLATRLEAVADDELLADLARHYRDAATAGEGMIVSLG